MKYQSLLAAFAACWIATSCASHRTASRETQLALLNIPIDLAYDFPQSQETSYATEQLFAAAHQGKCTEAVSFLSDTVRTQSIIDLIYFEIARCYFHAGDWHSTHDYAEQASQIATTSSPSHPEIVLLHLVSDFETGAIVTPASILKTINPKVVRALLKVRFTQDYNLTMIEHLLYHLVALPYSRNLHRLDPLMQHLFLNLLRRYSLKSLLEHNHFRQAVKRWLRERTFPRRLARNLFARKDYDTALTYFAMDFKRTRHLDSMSRSAKVYKLRNQPDQQEKALKRRLRYARSVEERQLSNILLGRFYWNRSKNRSAERLFKRAIGLNRHNDFSASAHYYLGSLYISEERFDESAKVLAAAAKLQPKGRLFQKRQLQSITRAADVALQTGAYLEAIRWYRLAYERDRYQLMRSEALFWIASIYEGMNEHVEARLTYARLAKEFPMSYYGFLAKKRLPASMVKDIDRREIYRALRPRLDSSTIDRLSATEKKQLLRFRELYCAHQIQFATREILAIRRSSNRPQILYYLANLFTKAGDAYQALRTTKIALNYSEGNPEPRWLPFLYPRPYATQLWNLAERYNLDPYLALSLIRQESEFHPLALSHADAYGLMQIIPSTARNTARSMNEEIPDIRRLFDPQFNLSLGMRHLSDLRRSFQGNTIDILGAYNGSAKAARRWRKKFGQLPPSRYIEEIPYGETRNYVKKILSNLAAYHAIYNGTSNHPDIP